MRYLILLVFILTSQFAAAATYKWVDEKGVTHYGDSVPPQYNNQGNTELNKKGIPVKKTWPVLTPEQMQVQEQELTRKKEEDKKLLDQNRKDSALLNTYTNEQEIDLARDRNLQRWEQIISSTEVRKKSAKTRLDTYQLQAAGFAKNKKPVPADLLKDIEAAKKSLQELEDTIAKSWHEREAVRIRFDSDKQRFQQLTQQQPAKN